MVLVNGRKFACEACIRGHRSSSCAHTGRQLRLVRPKGRPNSQCETCREKRANGSFHGRCDCEGRGDDKKTLLAKKVENNVEMFVPYAGSASAESQDGSTDGVDGANGKGRHSLEALLNPCQCRTTGVCSCCGGGSKQTSKADGTKASVDMPASCGCNGGDKCCDDGMGLYICNDVQHPDRITLTTTERASGAAGCCGGAARPAATFSALQAVSISSETSKKAQASCCGGKATTAPTITATQSHSPPLPVSPLFPNDALSPDHAAIMQPDCHCGPDCTCPGCMNEGEESKGMRAMGIVRNEECPEKCLTCSACVLGLTRPSGIEAIDKWMEDDKHAQEDAATQAVAVAQQTAPSPVVAAQEPIAAVEMHDEESSRNERAAKRAKRHTARSPAKPLQPVHPALPPFPQAKTFFDQHFLDPERRRYFAGHVQAAALQKAAPVKNLAFGKRISGESDEQWQARHGFSYLTPEAIEIFDRAKNFREERRLQEERDSMVSTSTGSPSPRLPPPTSAAADELTMLRQKALAARRRVPAEPMRS